MKCAARLPVDCPRCENRGVLALDDDRTLPKPWLLVDVHPAGCATRYMFQAKELWAVLQNMHGFGIELTHAVLEWSFRACARMEKHAVERRTHMRKVWVKAWITLMWSRPRSKPRPGKNPPSSQEMWWKHSPN